MREAVQVARLQPHRLEQLHHAVLELPPICGQTMDDQRLADDSTHGVARVQGRERVLEDDLHVAPHLAQRLAFQGRYVATLEPDLARTRLDQAQDAAAGGRFAAAGFPDQAECFASGNIEADAVHRVHRRRILGEQAAFQGEILAQRTHR